MQLHFPNYNIFDNIFSHLIHNLFLICISYRYLHHKCYKLISCINLWLRLINILNLSQVIDNSFLNNHIILLPNHLKNILEEIMLTMESKICVEYFNLIGMNIMDCLYMHKVMICKKFQNYFECIDISLHMK